MTKYVYTFLIVFCCCTQIEAQKQFPFQNEQLDLETRLKDLVSRLTLEEKISQLMSDAPAIARLNTPKYNWWNESLHGVARAGYATVFPQSISIAASWDAELVREEATAISDEARAKHHEYLRRDQHDIYQGLTMWSPNINIFRDPRWGRGHETYGEDPFLTGTLGAQYVKGLQGDDPEYLKVVATAKHFAVHSGPEESRHYFDANTMERDLWETYLPAFRMLVKDAQVQSVMTAYNRFRGEAASSNKLLFDILRNKWEFDGYVVSDCGAINDIWEDHKITADAASASALALETGTDLNCGATYKSLKEAIANGLITEEKINIAIERLFRARLKLGMFDTEENVRYATIPFSVNTNASHTALARKAAQESIVLLKNEAPMLPLSKDLKQIAVIGPNAHNVQSLWGNYNGTPKNPVTVVQGIRNKVAPQVKVVYEEGASLAQGMPTMQVIPSVYFRTASGKQGLDAAYFDNTKWEGDPLFTQIDDNVDFTWDINTPDPRLALQEYSVRWSGFLSVPETGTYYFSDWGKPYLDFQIEDLVSGGGKHTHHPSVNAKEVYLEAGKNYAITIKYSNLYGNAEARMLWSTPEKNKLERAVNLAEDSDVTVLVLGLNERLEGEEMRIDVEGFSKGDRTALDLPLEQRELMRALVATGKPIVLVLLNGSALAINYAQEHVPAILSAGYPGQEGGNAIADVLFGDYNPAGRLPVTYYKSVDDLPDFEDYSMKGRTYRYFEGEALYSFGYGLSYTQFSYDAIKTSGRLAADNILNVQVTVTNSGDHDGDEVVQLYLKDEVASTTRPQVQLVGFKRIHLQKGETQTVEFRLDARQFSMINDQEQLVVEPGWFMLYAGGGQPNKKQTESSVSMRYEVTGKPMRIAF